MGLRHILVASGGATLIDADADIVSEIDTTKTELNPIAEMPHHFTTSDAVYGSPWGLWESIASVARHSLGSAHYGRISKWPYPQRPFLRCIHKRIPKITT